MGENWDMESTSPIHSSKKKTFCFCMLNYTECVSFSWPWNDFSVEVWFDFQNASFKFIEYILIGRCESKTYVYTHWSVFRYCHRNMMKKPCKCIHDHISHI